MMLCTSPSPVESVLQSALVCTKASGPRTVSQSGAYLVKHKASTPLLGNRECWFLFRLIDKAEAGLCVPSHWVLCVVVVVSSPCDCGLSAVTVCSFRVSPAKDPYYRRQPPQVGSNWSKCWLTTAMSDTETEVRKAATKALTLDDLFAAIKTAT